LLFFEKETWKQGIVFIAGIDEAGRGPLAGPVVAAAAILPKKTKLPSVNDSKKLSERQRDELRELLLAIPGFRYALAEIQADEIDRLNILKATHLAMRRAVLQLPETEIAFVDGLKVQDMPVKCRFIVKGDAKSASIASASILAKIHRDAIMLQYAEKYPEYGFDRHKGYGTAEHMVALKKHGPCPIHRKSFAPVRELLNPSPLQGELAF
jgi:ribonuclease HII